MTTIELKNGYYIELDRLNYMLKRKCTGKDRNGAEKESTKDLGYFGDIREAVLRFLKLVQADVLDGETIGIKEYAELVEWSNKLAVQGLEGVLSRFEVK